MKFMARKPYDRDGQPARVTAVIGALGLVLFCGIAPAHAYVGPGAGVTMLGALWGVILAFLFAIGGILIWPIRSILRRRKKKMAADKSQDKPSDAN